MRQRRRYIGWLGTGVFDRPQRVNKVLGASGLVPSHPVIAIVVAVIVLIVAATSAHAEDRRLILVRGAAGNADYGRQFETWATRWQTAASQGGLAVQVIGQADGDVGDREQLQAALTDAAKVKDGELWLVFLGHGTFDRRDAKFNLRGSDVSAAELKDWLAPIQRPTAVVFCAASTGPFLPTLAKSGRIVITATKSGGENNFSRFGEFLSVALTDETADLDKDEQVSLCEAWLAAAQRTADFYKTDGRLQTEHSLLDDDGDGKGTRPDAYRGLQPADDKLSPADGPRAHQWHLVRSAADAKLPPEIRTRRDALELQVRELRAKKAALPEDEYYQQLETLLLDLTRLSRGTPPPGKEARPKAGF